MRRKIMSFIVCALCVPARQGDVAHDQKTSPVWAGGGRQGGRSMQDAASTLYREEAAEELYGWRQPRSCHRESCASVRERPSLR